MNHLTFRRRVWRMSLLGFLCLVALCFLLAACTGNTPPAGTSPETDSAGDSADIPTDTAPVESIAISDTESDADSTATGGEEPAESSGASGGEVITLPAETLPEPETEPDGRTMPRLDIRTDNGGDITSKDTYVHATVTLSGCHEKFAFTDVGAQLRVRGNSTAVAPKKPYRLKFDEKRGVLGLSGGNAFRNWCLMADYYDGSMLRTFGTFKFAKALMENEYFSADCTHVEVYVNGDYRGVYLLCDQTQIHRNRIDIPEKADGDTSVEIGYLLIGQGGRSDEPESVVVYPEITVYDRNGESMYFDGMNFALSGNGYTEEQKAYVTAYVSGVFKVVAKAVYEKEYYNLTRDGRLTPKKDFAWAKTDEEKQMETVSGVFNIEAAVSMCILDEIVKNLDAMTFNMYIDLSPNGDGVLTLAAPWDFDFSMANTHYPTTHAYTGFYATNLSESEGVRTNLWYVMLGSIDWFEEMVKAHWQENYTELRTVVSEMISVNYAYDAAFNRDFDRWGKPADRNLIHHHAQGDLATFDNHMKAGSFVTDWLTMRLWWLNRQWGDGTADDGLGVEPAPELELIFEDEQDLALINGIKRSTVELTDGNGLLLRPDATAYDPYFSFDYDLLPQNYEALFYPVLEFTYKVPVSNSQESYVTELFLCTGEVADATGGISTVVETRADGQWHTVRIDLSATGFWSGTIHEIRFDFFSSCEAGDKMYLKEFKLLTE